MLLYYVRGWAPQPRQLLQEGHRLSGTSGTKVLRFHSDGVCQMRGRKRTLTLFAVWSTKNLDDFMISSSFVVMPLGPLGLN